MSRWLLDKNVSVQETELPLHSDEELQCTPRGQVLLLPGAKSMTDLCVEKSTQLEEQRAKWKSENLPHALRKKIDEMIGTHLSFTFEPINETATRLNNSQSIRGTGSPLRQ
jgi:hypothetical protein